MVPVPEALRLMAPFMFKCFNKPWTEKQLPDGWSVTVAAKVAKKPVRFTASSCTPSAKALKKELRYISHNWCYYHKQTKKISYTRPQ